MSSMATEQLTGTDSADEAGNTLGSVPPEDETEFRILATADDVAQPSLFPSSELFVPSGGISQYRKGIAALHSVPVSRSHTLNSRRVMDAIVALVQIHYKKLPRHQVETLREMSASPLFRVTKGELRKMAGIASKDFGRIEDVLELLHDMKINWNVQGEDQVVDWRMTSRFLASYGIGVGKRTANEVCFSIDPRVLELILEPALWIWLNLDVQHQLGTETSYALYQNAWRYIGTTNKVTADFPVENWIELLMGPSRYVQPDPKSHSGKRVVEYSEWKKRYLLPAMERVNNLPALAYTLELIETRSGLKVKRLQFRFIPKRQVKLDLPMTWPEAIVDTLKGLGFSGEEIADLGQGFSLDDIIESMSRYRQAEERMRAKQQRISSPKAFYTGILTNVSSQAALDEEQLVALEKKARAAEAERLSKERQQRAQHDFTQWQTKRFIAAVGELSDERRAELIGAFEASADFKKARLLLTKGWESKSSYGAWTILKAWLSREQPAVADELLPNPEDRSLEAWLMWRIENPDTGT